MTTTTLRTVLRTFSFDTSTTEGRDAWKAFKAERKAEGVRIHGPVLSDVFHAFLALDGKSVDLETKHLFDNQWNTTPIEGVSDKGLRVFDYALQAEGNFPNARRTTYAPHGIKRGHYLEQTVEMLEIRLSTVSCGYTGRQEPAARGSVFNLEALDSEYLEEEELHLLRMLPVRDSGIGAKRPPLTEAESAYLVPLYREAQRHGLTERGKARLEAKRAALNREFDATVQHATRKRDGFVWLMDRGINTDNVIYYPHTETFSFGWRTRVSPDFKSFFLEHASEFPFRYEILCADGRKLQG